VTYAIIRYAYHNCYIGSRSLCKLYAFISSGKHSMHNALFYLVQYDILPPGNGSGSTNVKLLLKFKCVAIGEILFLLNRYIVAFVFEILLRLS
jgi:hypothetical protein